MRTLLLFFLQFFLLQPLTSFANSSADSFLTKAKPPEGQLEPASSLEDQETTDHLAFQCYDQGTLELVMQVGRRRGEDSSDNDRTRFPTVLLGSLRARVLSTLESELYTFDKMSIDITKKNAIRMTGMSYGKKRNELHSSVVLIMDLASEVIKLPTTEELRSVNPTYIVFRYWSGDDTGKYYRQRNWKDPNAVSGTNRNYITEAQLYCHWFRQVSAEDAFSHSSKEMSW